MQALIADWLEGSAHSEATNKGNIPPVPTHQGVSWHSTPETDRADPEYKERRQCFRQIKVFDIQQPRNLSLVFLFKCFGGGACLEEPRTSCFHLSPEWAELTQGNQGGREREVESRALLSVPLFANQQAQGGERKSCEQEIGEDI